MNVWLILINVKILHISSIQFNVRKRDVITSENQHPIDSNPLTHSLNALLFWNFNLFERLSSLSFRLKSNHLVAAVTPWQEIMNSRCLVNWNQLEDKKYKNTFMAVLFLVSIILSLLRITAHIAAACILITVLHEIITWFLLLCTKLKPWIVCLLNC